MIAAWRRSGDVENVLPRLLSTPLYLCKPYSPVGPDIFTVISPRRKGRGPFVARGTESLPGGTEARTGRDSALPLRYV